MRDGSHNRNFNLIIPSLRDHKSSSQRVLARKLTSLIPIPIPIPILISVRSLKQQHSLIIKFIHLELRILIDLFYQYFICWLINLSLLILLDHQDNIRRHKSQRIGLEDNQMLMRIRTRASQIFQQGNLMIFADGNLPNFRQLKRTRLEGDVFFICRQLGLDLETFLEGNLYLFCLVYVAEDMGAWAFYLWDVVTVDDGQQESQEEWYRGTHVRGSMCIYYLIFKYSLACIQIQILKQYQINNIKICGKMGKKEQRKGLSETAIDTTINIHKLAHKTQFKRKAPKALTSIRNLVAKMMKTKDVRIDPKLNQFIWNQGVRNLPRRVRVRISRKRTEDQGKGSEWYSLVQHINTEDFSAKLTEKAKVSA